MVLEKNILDSLLEWAKVQLLLLGEETNFEIEPLREEASSRKYFRLKLPNKSLVLVSSSSEIDSSLKFASLSSEFLNKGINVPEVYSFDKSQGFMLIEDFGENLYQDLLNEENEQQFYESAFDELIKIQKLNLKYPNKLDQDTALEQMNLFEDWFLDKYLSINPKPSEKDCINSAYQFILNGFFAQPQVTCHFDFETRNLMQLSSNETGVLDFQDAVIGPIFLDVASLIKDLYQNRDVHKEKELLLLYTDKALESQLLDVNSSKNWSLWLDMAGMQRQLRILGTLVRLHLRDKKSFRLIDLPKTLDYLIDASKRYKELSEFSNFLEKVSFMLNKKDLKVT